MIADNLLQRIALRILLVILLATLVACVITAVISFADVPSLMLGVLIGVVLIGALHEVDYRRSTRSLETIGRDVPVPTARTVLRERAPAGPATPTRWRNEHRDRSDTNN